MGVIVGADYLGLLVPFYRLSTIWPFGTYKTGTNTKGPGLDQTSMCPMVRHPLSHGTCPPPAAISAGSQSCICRALMAPTYTPLIVKILT